MGDERGPWIGTAWMVSTSASGGPRPRVMLTWAVGVVLLLGVLGAAGPRTISAALPLPPVDTSEVGATGRVPDAGLPPAPAELPGEPLLPGAPLPGSGSGSGVPETMLAAYRGAEASMGAAAPDCHLSWALVAGIGKVESSHAYGGSLSSDGITTSPILGPQLDGTNGNAAITDSDGGALDHDTVWDRAVGPTQFIPTSWRTYGADGNGDGTADPDNAFDAALATGRYLCAGGTDLATASGRHDAVFRYNHSESYVATVLRWADAYASGALPVPDTEGGIPDATLASGSPTLAAFPTPGAGAAPADAGLLGGSPAPAAPAAPAAPSAPGPSAAPGLLDGTPVGPSSSAAAVPGSPAAALPAATPDSAALPAAPALPAAAPVPAAPSSSAGSSPRPTSSTGTSSGTPSKPTPPASSSSTPPASTTPSTTSTTPPASTTTTPPKATPSAAERCTASLPAVAKAFGVPAAELKAATSPGPKTGQLTCTVTRAGKPLVVAVAATTADAPAPVAGAGVTRSVAGGRVVLTVPTTADTPRPAATAALAKLAPAWA